MFRKGTRKTKYFENYIMRLENANISRYLVKKIDMKYRF